MNAAKMLVVLLFLCLKKVKYREGSLMVPALKLIWDTTARFKIYNVSHAVFTYTVKSTYQKYLKHYKRTTITKTMKGTEETFTETLLIFHYIWFHVFEYFCSIQVQLKWKKLNFFWKATTITKNNTFIHSMKVKLITATHEHLWRMTATSRE